MKFGDEYDRRVIELDSVSGILSRPLTAQDKGRLTDHFRRMNEVDRYTRFFSAVSDDGIANIVDGFDWTRMLAVGAFRDDLLIGVAELGWEAHSPPMRAELAMSVDRAFRNLGLATWLIEDVCKLGQDQGIREIYATWVGGNDAVGRIMNRFNARVGLDSSVCRGEIDLCADRSPFPELSAQN